RDADRTSAESLDDRDEQLAIDFIETVVVDFEHAQRFACDLDVDLSIALHLRVIADASQQTIRDSWSSTRASRDLLRAAGVDRDVQDLRGSPDDHFERVDVV